MNTTNFTRTLMLTVAAIAASSTSLMAQVDNRLTADIPFAFELRGAPMSAGKYEVSLMRTNASAGSVIRFRNTENNRSYVTAANIGDNSKASNPEISFRCANERCVAARITPGNGATYALPVRMLKNSDDSGMVLTRVRLLPAGL